MAKNNNLKDFLTDLYEGIASKKPNASRNPQNFRSEIESISGGTDTTDATATSSDILLGKTAYVNDVKVEGTIETYDGSNDGVESMVNSIKVVDEFPLNEAVEDNTIYISDTPKNADVLIVHHLLTNLTGMYDHIRTLKDTIGITYTCTVVDTLPENPIISDVVNYSVIVIYIYEDIPYLYTDIGYGNMWIKLSDILGSIFEYPIVDSGVFKGTVGNYEILSAETYYLYVTYNTTKSIGIKAPDREFYNLDETSFSFETQMKDFLNDTLNTLVLPRGMKRISDLAVATKHNLENIINTNEIEVIGGGSFRGCNSLIEVSFPNCTYIGDEAFNYCTSLIKANFPNCTYIGIDAFEECQTLAYIKFDECITVDSGAFFMCNMREVELPKCITIDQYAFMRCSMLETVKLPICNEIYQKAFSETPDFDMYLGSTTVVNLHDTNVFDTSVVAPSVKNIHVRPELVSQYEEATNWSALIAEGKIIIIGDYTDETN